MRFLDLPETGILNRIVEEMDPQSDQDRFQVLAPMYKGPAGIEAVNEALQQVFNPPAATGKNWHQASLCSGKRTRSCC